MICFVSVGDTDFSPPTTCLLYTSQDSGGVFDQFLQNTTISMVELYTADGVLMETPSNQNDFNDGITGDCLLYTSLWKNDRFWTSRKKELTKKMAADLLKKGRTNVKGMWSEKKQAAYDAAVILDDTGGKYINFKLEFPKRKEGVNGRK